MGFCFGRGQRWRERAQTMRGRCPHLPRRGSLGFLFGRWRLLPALRPSPSCIEQKPWRSSSSGFRRCRSFTRDLQTNATLSRTVTRRFWRVAGLLKVESKIRGGGAALSTNPSAEVSSGARSGYFDQVRIYPSGQKLKVGAEIRRLPPSLPHPPPPFRLVRRSSEGPPEPGRGNLKRWGALPITHLNDIRSPAWMTGIHPRGSARGCY